MVDEHERFKLLMEIEEAASVIRQQVIIMILCLIAYAITIGITVFEMFRIGPLDPRTIAWFVMTIVFYAMMKANTPPLEKMERYNSLVNEYKKKGYK